MNKLSPLELKVNLVIKELDTAFDSYARHHSQISTLRGWTLTVFLAFVGFLITLKSSNFLIVVPFGVVMLLFIRLEAREKLAADFDSAEVSKVEKIFMETDSEKFANLIQECEFRDLRLRKLRSGVPYSKMEVFRYMISRSVIAWYGLQLVLVLAIYLAVVLRWI